MMHALSQHQPLKHVSSVHLSHVSFQWVNWAQQYCQGSGRASAELTKIEHKWSVFFPSSILYGVDDRKPQVEHCALTHNDHSFWPLCDAIQASSHCEWAKSVLTLWAKETISADLIDNDLRGLSNGLERLLRSLNNINRNILHRNTF